MSNTTAKSRNNISIISRRQTNGINMSSTNGDKGNQQQYLKITMTKDMVQQYVHDIKKRIDTNKSQMNQTTMGFGDSSNFNNTHISMVKGERSVFGMRSQSVTHANRYPINKHLLPTKDERMLSKHQEYQNKWQSFKQYQKSYMHSRTFQKLERDSINNRESLLDRNEEHLLKQQLNDEHEKTQFFN
eukprot:403377230